VSDGARRTRGLAWILFAAVAAAAAVVYLQTAHAFRAVVVPLIDAAIDGSLRVEGGSCRASGRIAAVGVVYRGPRVDIDIETVAIELAPFSLLWGEPLRLRELTLLGANVEMRPAERDAAAGDGDDASAWDWYELAAPVALPVAVEHARVEGRWVRRGRSGEVLERWTSVRLELDDLDAARRARLTLSADVALDPDARELGYVGRAAFEIEASVDEAALVRDLDGTGQFELVPLSEPDSPPLRFAFELSREPSAEGGARIAALARTMREQSELGQTRVELRAAPEASEGANANAGVETTRAPVELRAEVESVTHDFVNPLIAAFAKGRLASGVIDGSLEGVWSPAANAFRARWEGTIRDLRLDAKGEQTPPLALRIDGETVWAPHVSLEIPSGSARLEAAGQRVVDLRLVAPLQWRRDAADPGGPAAAPDEHELELRIDDLDLALLRMGLSMFDLPFAAPLEPAHLDAVLRANALRADTGIDVVGTWRLRGLGDTSGDASSPLTLSGVIDARADPPRGARVERFEAELSRGERALAALRGSGSFAKRGGRTEIDWALAAPDLSAALKELPVLTPSPSVGPQLREGRLDAQGALTREAVGAPLRVSGTFDIDALTLRAARTWSTSLRGSARLELGTDAITVEHVEVERSEREGGEDVPAATLAVTGVIPLTSGVGTGPANFQLRLEERDVRPWLELSGLETSFASEPLPLRGAWEMWIERSDLALRAEGWQSIGLQVAGLRDVRLQQRLTRSATGAIEFEAEFHGQRQPPPHDSIELAGSFQEGAASSDEPARLDVGARIDSLTLADSDLRIRDSDLAADLELTPRGERLQIVGALAARNLALESSAEAKPSTPLANAPLLDAPLPHTHAPALDADLAVSIERLQLVSDSFEQIAGQIALTDGRLRIQMDRARLWGGALAADFATHWDEATPTVALRASLAEGNIARFFEGRKASGGLDAALDLSGTGDTLRALLASARGEAELVIGEVEFDNAPLGVLGKDILQILFSEFRPGRTGRLNCVVTRSDVYDGHGRVGVVMSTPESTLAGGGALDLRELEAELVLRSRSKRASIGAVRTPIRVSGPLDDLRAGPDAAGVAKDSAKVVAFGMINPFLIVVPFIDLGSGGENPCEQALASLSSEGPPDQSLLGRSRRLLGDTDRSVRQWLGGERDEAPQ
jgi:hypothetical protein